MKLLEKVSMSRDAVKFASWLMIIQWPPLRGVQNTGGAFFTRSRMRLCGRSEEHTSELQSLMRISYAVFCLKKKITTSPHTRQTTTHHYISPHMFISTTQTSAYTTK